MKIHDGDVLPIEPPVTQPLGEALMLEAIPLIMAAVCLGYGLYILHSQDGTHFFAVGHIVISLAAICLALFGTVVTIFQQIIGRYHAFHRYVLPILGYAVAIITFGWGVKVIDADTAELGHIIAGHVMCGSALIAVCVSTVTVASTWAWRIPLKAGASSRGRRPEAFAPGVERVLIAIPLLCTVGGLGTALSLLLHDGSRPHFIAGHLLAAQALVCAALIVLVVSLVRQIANTYQPWERRVWPLVVAVLGAINLGWGLTLVLAASRPDWTAHWVAPGWAMMGLGLVCFSILAKVALLGLGWRRTFPLAKRMALIPVVTTLMCLFTAAFLFQDAPTNANLEIPARVLVGLGAICFSIFSNVSILESVTSDEQSASAARPCLNDPMDLSPLSGYGIGVQNRSSRLPPAEVSPRPRSAVPNNHCASAGNRTAEMRPATISAVAFISCRRPSSVPTATATTMNGRLVAWSRPVASASRHDRWRR